MTFKRTRIVLAFVAALAASPALAAAPVQQRCEIGAYRLTDGQLVDVGATGDAQVLRWRRFDGETGALKAQADGSWTSTFGWTERPDGRTLRFDCAAGTVRFGEVTGRRVPLSITETTFQAGDVTLTGRLILPPSSGKVPIVVLVHGSEPSSARDTYALQRMLPAQGVGAFVYDKRGTGASGGQYTQNFSRLADDAVAAMAEARRLAGRRAGRVGYQGGSQGGWIAPLAAFRAPADFVIVSFGLAVSPVEEDNQEIALEMALAGHGPQETAKALEVAASVQAMFASRFTTGIERFEALREKYKIEPWWKDLRGNMTRIALGMTDAELRAAGSQFNWGTPLYYQSMPVLRGLDTPQIWILGEDDLDAPSAETSRRLEGLIAQGKPITLAMVPGAEHGMTEFEVAPDGERLSTRFAPGYFALMVDYARTGQVRKDYGRMRITGPAR